MLNDHAGEVLMPRFLAGMILAGWFAGSVAVFGQLTATDDFEPYTGSPIGQAGGTGDWTGAWQFNSQVDGGAYLNTNSKISSVKSVGLYGAGGSAGTSISRPFPACTNDLVIRASFRGDINLESANPPSNRRVAFTIRTGNDASHFGNQRLSFFFAQGSTSLQWYDGVNRMTNAVTYANGHTYDLQVTMSPVDRTYVFSISNRNNNAITSYSGAWSTGADGDPIGSVAFMMRGPTGAGNDAFLDNVSISAPEYVAPPPSMLPLKEGAEWRYFKGTATPSAQGTNQWYHRGFSDIAWLGPSPSGFGYGDADDATLLSDMQNSYVSVFTRKMFLVTNLAAITQLTLAADFDDGFVAYLNGTEVTRRNLPTGTITHATTALVNSESSRAGQDSYTCNCEPQPKEYIQIDPSLLIEGTNLLAVSGHNISLSSSDFSLIVELHTNVTLTRGPFLQMPDLGRVSVLWRTAALTDGAVDYGYDTDYTSGTISDNSPVRVHEIQLPAFPPGSTVYYRVRSGGEVMNESHFVSPKMADQPFRLLVMSDYGTSTTNTVAVAQMALAQNPDVMITCGDNVQHNSAPVGLFDSDWFGPLSGLIARVPMMTALGNHDIRIEQGRWYLDAVSLPTNGPPGMAERMYSFDYGNAHFVMVDANAFVPDGDTTYTNPAAMRDAIITWLTNDLHATTQTWKFVAYHQPPYTSQGFHGDAEVMKANLSPIFEKYGVNIAFQGHNHFYERINPINGVHYFTVGSGGYSIHGLSNQREFSAKIFRDKYDFLIIDIDGPRLLLRCLDQDGVEQDRYDINLEHPFKMDGLLDSTNWVRAANGLQLNAAIRGEHLYVATQDAGEGNDHFVYVSTSAAPLQAVNWSKSGQVMGWGAYLADENGGGGGLAGFYGWFNASGQLMTNTAVARALTSGLNNNSTYGNGVLEGTLHLNSYFGIFPTQLLMAAAPYDTLDGGILINNAQVPAGNGNGDIDANEFLAISTRNLALDLPVAHIAPPTGSEAGMLVAVDGSGSVAPSGLPLSYAWSQVDGPPGAFSNAFAAVAAFRLTNQVAGTTSAVVRLEVFDTRFVSESTTSIVFVVMSDSDGDGLSDQEELTGMDNILTPANPGGQVSNPAVADSDGDGVPDGEEALAGTSPGNSNSVFKIMDTSTAVDGNLRVQWASVSGKWYKLEYSTNLLHELTPLYTNIPATAPVNVITVEVDGANQQFYVIETQ